MDEVLPLPHSEENSEAARLAELASFHVVGTPREEPFDALVEIAAALFDVPLAVINFVDADTGWCKAGAGCAQRVAPRDELFCGTAVRSTRTLVVEDARLDPQFWQNPYVTPEDGLRFYAGAPLVTTAGHVVGTFCVLDFQPRTFGRTAVRRLEKLARQTVGLLELRRMVGEMSDLLDHVSHARARLELRSGRI